MRPLRCLPAAKTAAEASGALRRLWGAESALVPGLVATQRAARGERAGAVLGRFWEVLGFILYKRRFMEEFEGFFGSSWVIFV